MTPEANQPPRPDRPQPPVPPASSGEKRKAGGKRVLTKAAKKELPMANGSDKGISMADLDFAYPILTEEVGGAQAPSGTGATAPSGLGQAATNAIRDVLGWRPKAGDAKGFVAALNGSFTTYEVEGHTEVRWTPRGYAVQADLGAVTGAQASLYARARAALDQMRPLVDGLRPLEPAADPEDCAAFQSMVGTVLDQLVAELGAPGGPRTPRVDTFFSILTGWRPFDKKFIDVDQVGGQLGKLQADFGLIRNNVNTVDEERVLTDFLTLVDLVGGLQMSWANQRAHFDRAKPGDGYFGTELVLLSRFLAAVAESVQEVRFCLDSVFLGESERQTLLLRGTSMSVSDLLGWVERFATEEGPRFITDGGKDGMVTAFTPIVHRLHNLVFRHLVVLAPLEEGMVSLRNLKNPHLPPAFVTARVQLAALQLADNLREVLERANQIRRFPDLLLIRVTPMVIPDSDKVTLVVFGTGFAEGQSIRLSRPDEAEVSPDSGTVRVGADTIQARFTTARITPGEWEVTVVDAKGEELAGGLSVFQVRDRSGDDGPDDD